MGNANYALQQVRSQKVYRTNEMVQRARYHITWQQNCILNFMLSLIKPDDSMDTIYEFNIDTLFSLLHYKTTSITKLREAIESIAKLSFWLISKDPNKDDIFVEWLDDIRTNRGERVVRFRFHHTIAPYLFNLVKNNKGRFSGYKLSYILSLSSYYAQRLYDILVSYSNNNKFCFELGTGSREHDLFILLCSDPTHDGVIPPSWLKDTSNFTKKILEPAIKEINEYTDLKVDYELCKYDLAGNKYRKFKSVIFYFRRRTEAELKKIDQRIDDNYKDIDAKYQKRLTNKGQLSIFDLEEESNERLNAVMEIEDDAAPEELPPENNKPEENEFISYGSDNYSITGIITKYNVTVKKVRERMSDITNNELAQIILEAERHIGDNVSPADHDGWVEKYITFYVDMVLFSANKTPTRTTPINRILDHLIRDYKDYAPVADKLFAQKDNGKAAPMSGRNNKSAFCDIESHPDGYYEEFWAADETGDYDSWKKKFY